jgi:hypothetical protein
MQIDVHFVPVVSSRNLPPNCRIERSSVVCTRIFLCERSCNGLHAMPRGNVFCSIWKTIMRQLFYSHLGLRRGRVLLALTRQARPTSGQSACLTQENFMLQRRHEIIDATHACCHRFQTLTQSCNLRKTVTGRHGYACSRHTSNSAAVNRLVPVNCAWPLYFASPHIHGHARDHFAHIACNRARFRHSAQATSGRSSRHNIIVTPSIASQLRTFAARRHTRGGSRCGPSSCRR